MRVGVIGCGTISHAYLENMRTSPHTEVIACGDDPPERAHERAREHGVARAGSSEDVLDNPHVELVVNLTVPRLHADITMAALSRGKHVWSEKPLAVSRAEGEQILDDARRRGLAVGCAPDTFLGAGLQTCRSAIDQGLVGQPLAASAFFMSAGPESWHHHPAFFFREGGGPLFDVGPYYLTALLDLLGPVRRVTASGRILFPERTVQRGPKRGEIIPVLTDTYVAGVLEFAQGAISTLVTIFGVWGADLPPIQVYGSEGVLGLPDPNTFGGPVRIRVHADDQGWRELPLGYQHTEGCRDCRGLGVVEMVLAIRAGRQPRASGELAFHVLDVMQGMAESAREGRHMDVRSTCERPRPLPIGTSSLFDAGRGRGDTSDAMAEGLN
jgi:predicted dehydrogenase